jgi:hypothetical protein
MVSKDEMKYVLSKTGWEVSEFLDFKGPFYIVIIKKTLD